MTTRDEDGTEWTQTFGPDNRLERVTDAVDTWTFTYDGDSLRTIQENPDGTTTAFLFGGQYEVALDAQGDTTSVKRYYTSSAGRVALRDGDGVHFFLTDHLGSVVAVLDDQGAVESGQRYLPYGGERYAAGIDETDYGYTGQRDLGGLGLMDYNARFYSPSIRRFISADSLVPDPASSQAFNRYSYVAGNPIIFTDPSGHLIDIGGAETGSDLYQWSYTWTHAEEEDLRSYKGQSGVCGEEVYDWYIDLWHQWKQGDSWISNEFTYGFSIYDALSLILAGELNANADALGVITEGGIRSFYEFRKYTSGDPNSDASVAELINWFAEHNGSAEAYAANGNRVSVNRR